MATLLVVEDEPHIASGLRFNLEAEGHSVEVVETGEAALDVVANRPEAVDCMVLDVMLPGIDGFAVARAARARGWFTPILMLTARGRADDILRGFEAGADDYLPKPFALRELLARVRAVLRRPGPRRRLDEFRFGDVRLHLRARQAFREGREVRLTRKEFDLLRYLIEHRGEIATRERLLDEVWGYERFPTTRTVDTHVLRLRQKFERDPERPAFILTVHGQGYRFAG